MMGQRSIFFPDGAAASVPDCAGETRAFFLETFGMEMRGRPLIVSMTFDCNSATPPAWIA